MSNILTAKEVAEILKISPWTVYYWSECGKIPSLKLGRLRRFRLDDVINALQNENKNNFIKEVKNENQKMY